jgi:hypothetical protein
MCKGEYILTDIGTDFILNMPRVDGEYLALALSTKESGPTRATVQGLRKYELDSILRRVEPYALKRTKPHFVLITEVIRILLESDAPKIDGITQEISRFDEDLKKNGWAEKPTQLFKWPGRKPTRLLQVHMFELHDQSRKLDTLQSNNEYILYLLENIKPHNDSEITEQNWFSKRIAEEQKLRIGCLQRNNRSLVTLV